MNEKLQNEIQSQIEAFASGVTAVLQRAVADAVASALAGKGGGRGRGGRRAAAGKSVAPEAVLRELKRQSGQRMEELARNLGTNTKSLGGPVRELLKSKSIKKSGQARGTRYRAAD